MASGGEAPRDHVESFPCMGATVRLVIGAPTTPRTPAAADTAAVARAWLDAYDKRLSRFRADSETRHLNDDPRERVPVSRLMRSLLGAAIWAAHRSNGLVDPTLVPALERSGYGDSRAKMLTGAALGEALAAAPPRRPAAPALGAPWRALRLAESGAIVVRPPGLQFDPAAVGKGLAADALASRLHGYDHFAIDCGGHVRTGGSAGSWSRYFVVVRNPLTGDTGYIIEVTGGGVSTSGVASRLWRRRDGELVHQLLDPSTGEPAWTGLLSATALAPTALEAEVLAKSAYLAGPAAARKILAVHGGVTIRESGALELHGRLARPRSRTRVAAAA